MIKSFLILICFEIFLFCSQQIVLVVADDFNATKASLELFENSKKVYTTHVNLAHNGLGWGLGEVQLQQEKGMPLKYEGDKKAPAGIFKLTDIFGYAFESDYKMPYLHTSKSLICVDDVDSPFYNQIIEGRSSEKSFEYMHRKDNQYKYGIRVAHNSDAIPKRGSCIFLHIQRDSNAPTVGCTSLKEKDILFLINWLDKSKNPLLIQIPKSSKEEILRLYPQLKDSAFL